MVQFTQTNRRRYTQPFTKTASTRNRPSLRLPKVRINWLAVVAVLAIILGGWYVFGSGHFRITNVIISGSLNDSISKELESLKGKNIVMLSVRQFELQLPKRQSSLKALHIVKGFPDTLKIDVSVREPVLIWKSSDSKYYIDGDGVVFTLDGTQTTVNDSTLATVNDTRNQSVDLGKQIVSKSFVAFISQLASSFHDKSGVSITGIGVGETTRFVDVSTDANITVKLDATRTLDPQLASLALILNQYRADIHQYVDLRVEGRAFYQ